MADAAKKPARYEDLLQVPAHQVANIIRGQLVTYPRPSPRHALASTLLGDELVSPFGKGRGGPGGWLILGAPELHLGPHVLVPDLAGWRRERLPALPETAWFELAPDWVCEVLSPAADRTDRSGKMPIYAEYGMQWLWLVDPDLQTLEVYTLKDGHWLLLETLSEDDTLRRPPFDAIEFSAVGAVAVSQWRTRKSLQPSSLAGAFCTPATWARGGPCWSHCSRRARASGVPQASTSTRPSGRLRT